MRRAQRRRRASGERIPLLGLGLDGPGWPAGGGGAGQGARRIQVGALVDPDPQPLHQLPAQPGGHQGQQHRKTSHRVVAWRTEAPRGDAGDPQGPTADGDASESAGIRSGLPAAVAVAGSIPTTVLAASSTHSLPLATARLLAPEIGMTAANRPRSKAGTVTTVPVGVCGGWVDRRVLGVSAAPEHAAAASSPSTTSNLCQRSATRRPPEIGGDWHGAAPFPGLQTEHPSLTSQVPGRCPGAERQHGTPRSWCARTQPGRPWLGQ
jgi:hypothetical protein